MTYLPGDKPAASAFEDFINPPRCIVTASGTASVANTTWTTAIVWDAEITDMTGSDAMHDPSVNPSRISIKKSGLYLVRVLTTWAAGATGGRLIDLRKNSGGLQSGGTSILRWDTQANPLNGSAMLEVEYPLTAGDYLEAFRYQSSGGNLAPTPAGMGNSMTVRRVAA